ncbi:MAG: hypothetical protein AB7F31_01425 [Parachlamydiales bacterium]
MEIAKEIFFERYEEKPDYNLACGLGKMALGAALMAVATRRFGAPALAVGAILSLAEIVDISVVFDGNALVAMGTSPTAQLGIRSFYRGLQFTTIALLGYRLCTGWDLSVLGLVKLGGYAVGTGVAIFSPALGGMTAAFAWNEEIPQTGTGFMSLSSRDPVTSGEKALLLLGLTRRPIHFDIRRK